MTKAEKIYIAGHRGMVGSAIARTLLAQGTPAAQIITRTHAELDLCNQQVVQDFFATQQPTQVYLAAAKGGGMHANNTYPADFIYQNLMMQANVIRAAHTQPMLSHINVGNGGDVTIPALAHAVAQAKGDQDAITFDITKPDGAPPQVDGKQPPERPGLAKAYADFLKANNV